MTTNYPYLPIAAYAHLDTATYNEKQSTGIVSSSSLHPKGFYSTWENGQEIVHKTIPLASCGDILTQLITLQNQIVQLQAEVAELKYKNNRIPLPEITVESVIDDAYKLKASYDATHRGEQISIYDGIESYVIRATERAHGIQ